MTPTALQNLTPPEAEEFLQTLADGVPPHNELTRWLTVGQEGILSEFQSNLGTVAEGGFETLLLLGDPGAGKSHILATLEQLAFDNEFATSFFSQDPQSRIGFNRPAQLYKKLVESLRLPESQTVNVDPLRMVLNKWVDQAAPVLGTANPSMAMAYKLGELGLIPPAKGISARTRLSLLGYLLTAQNGNEEARVTFLNIMRGPGVTNTVLMQTIGSLDFFYPYGVGYTPSDYDEKYYFGQLRTLIFILRVVGYKGLVALFDEVTAIVGLYSRSREKAYRVLNSLFFNEWEYEGFYTVFAYLPAFINQLRADRYLSGGDLMEKWSPIWERSMRQVAPLNSHQMFELARRLAMIHSISWEWDAWPAVANIARAWIRDCEWQRYSLRDYVRGLIQRFDQYKDENVLS